MMLLTTRAVPLLTAVGGAYFAFEDERHKATRSLASVRRVANLVRVVGIMSTDYAYHYHWKQKEMTKEIEIRNLELDAFQRSYASTFAQLMRAENSVERRRLQEQVNAQKRAIDSIAGEVFGLMEVRERDNRSLHDRNAQRLRDMCASNGGVYIKLGQHLAMLDHILPPEYQERLSTLLDQNPTSPMSSVDRIFMEDFGLKPSDIFDSFESIPIASASLAQVHIAIKDGNKYAVKVQHEGLREGSAFDRLVITKLVDLVPKLFDDFNYSWLTKEMNQNLPMELNFLQEIENMERAANYLSDRVASGDVALPRPNHAISSARVLTMSFEEGSYMHKLDLHSWPALRKEDIATLVSSIFCDQIFRHGFVHCDPHEANLLVRPHPSDPTKPQIVLLDHGLYRQLDDSFRRDYCRLWQSIMLTDEKGIEQHCKHMNAGPAYPLLAAMLTLKPWDDIMSDAGGRMHGHNSPTETALLRTYAQQYFREIVQLLGSVPSDLLLVFKTNDCLRHIDKVLGTPINSTATAAAVAADVILREDLADAVVETRGWSLLSRVCSALWMWCRVQVRLSFLQVFRWAAQMENLLDSLFSSAYAKVFSFKLHM